MRWTLGSIAEHLDGLLDGPSDLPLSRPVTAATSDPRGIAFAESEDYLQRAEDSGVGAVLIPPDMRKTHLPAIRIARPRAAFFRLLHMYQRPPTLAMGVHSTAVVHPEAEVDPTACIGAYAVIEAGARIGAGAQVFPLVYVGDRCEIGPGVTLYPHVVLMPDVRIGAGAVVQAGAVLGADGFGYYWDGQQRVKIPQVGGVEVGERVEIGALAAVDRATAGETRIGEGVKIDNLVQVGHNCVVGDHTVVAGMTAVAGSVRIGRRAVIGGHVSVNDGVRIGDDVTLGGRSGVIQDVTEPGEYFGIPAIPVQEALRSMLLAQRLPELFRRLKTLEREVAQLRSEEESA